MKTIYLFLISFVFFCPGVLADQTKEDISKAEYVDGIYIPRNLEEAWSEMEKKLTIEDRHQLKSISENDMIKFHFSSGMGIRNDWGLWRGSRLAKYFNNIGILHPDDMSGIILRTFWCHINNKPIRLDERIAYYKEFWIRRSEPSPDTFPEKYLEEIGAQNYPTNEGQYVGYIRIYQNKNTGNAWLYEYKKGWKRVDNDFLDNYPHWKETINKNP